MPQAALSHADVRRLKLVIDVGRELEAMWIELPTPSDLAGSRRREHALERLVSAIHALEQADDENVRRLSFHTRNLSLEMTQRHLSTVLVPFERLQGKGLRDDQILVIEGDQAADSVLRKTAPMIVIADNLRSAFNVGAILRTAECFGVEHVSLAGYTPTPDQEKTAKTSLGTENSVSWSSDKNVHDVIAQAKRGGYEVIALETAHSAVTLEAFKWPEKCALLLGNERFGLDRDVLEEADHIVKIPMHGAKNSLNVGIACGITLAAWRANYDRAVEEARATSAPTPSQAPAQELAAVTYAAVGVFHSDQAKNPYDAPRQAVVDDTNATIELRYDLPLETLKDLATFDRIWLIYDFNRNENWKPLVLPPRGPHEKRGVFATRSPYRPNSIGISATQLVKIEGRTLHVRGTDLLDGTPVLDIKPYIAYADSFPKAKLGWLDGVEEQRFNVTFADKAESQLQWLEAAGLQPIRAFLQAQLEFDPIDSERKRVHPAENGFQIAYRTWRANFVVENRNVTVTKLSSGYSLQDLSMPLDKYADKNLHRAFIEKFPT